MIKLMIKRLVKLIDNKKVGEGIDDKVNDSKIDNNKIGEEI